MSGILSLLTSYAFGKAADFAISKLKKTPLRAQLEKDFDAWADDLPEELGEITLDALFRTKPQWNAGPAQSKVYERFRERIVPTEAQLLAALLERWSEAREAHSTQDLVPFFGLEPSEARRHLEGLARRVRAACAVDSDLFQRTMLLVAGEEEDTDGSTDAGHEMEIKLAIEKLATVGFREVGDVLANKRRFHFDKLKAATRFELLYGLGRYHALQLNTAESAKFYREAAREIPGEPRAAVCHVRALAIEERVEEAREEALRLVNEYPTDLKLWALRVRLHTPQEIATDLAAQSPAGWTTSHEVLSALAHVALSAGERTVALEYAEKARRAGSRAPSNYAVIGTALLTEYDREEPWAEPLVADPADEPRIRRAIQHFDDGLAACIGSPSEEPIVAQLLTHKADALSFVGDSNLGTWLSFARERLPKAPETRRAYAVWLGNRGALGDAIGLLREVVAEHEHPRAMLELGTFLARKGGDQLLGEAASFAVRVLGEPPSQVEPWVRQLSLRLAVKSFTELGEHAKAEDLLTAAEESMPAECALLRVETARAQSDKEGVRTAALAAATLLTGRLPAWDAATLCAVLLDLEEFAPALDVVDGVPVVERTELLMRYEVFCCARLGRDSDTLKRAKAHRDQHGFEADVLHLELDARDGDPVGAAALMEDYLAARPGDRLVWLRRSRLGIRESRSEWIETGRDRLPDPDVCDPRNGRLAAQLLGDAGLPDDALDYAFRLFRANFESGDAREALLDVIYKTTSRPDLAEPEAVKADCAVTLQGQLGVEFSVVIESGPEPVEIRNEFPPASPLAKCLLGKRVGDSVNLPSMGTGLRPARIARIINKHAYWAQRLLVPAAVPSRVPGAMRVVPTGETPEQMIAAMRRMLTDNRTGTLAVLTSYRGDPRVSVPAVAEALGSTTFHMVLEMLGRPDGILRAPAAPDSGVPKIEDMSLVLDDTAIATLVSLDVYELLPGVAQKLLLTPAMAAELRHLTQRAGLHREHSRVSLDRSGEVAITTLSDGQLESLRADAEAIVAWFLSTCETRPAVWQGTDLPPRKQLELVFGRSALQAIAIAAESGSVLVTDDQAHADLGRTQGVQSVSTLNVLAHLAERSILSAEAFLRLKLQLIGCGYLGVSFSRLEVASAGNLSEWCPDTRPLRDCFGLLQNRHISTDARAAMALAVISGAFQCAKRSEVRDKVVAKALWAVEVLGIGDESLDALSSMVRASLRADHRSEFELLLKRRHALLSRPLDGTLIVPAVRDDD